LAISTRKTLLYPINNVPKNAAKIRKHFVSFPKKNLLFLRIQIYCTVDGSVADLVAVLPLHIVWAGTALPPSLSKVTMCSWGTKNL